MDGVGEVQAELTAAQLERVGAGWEKTVFASAHWVVKAPRSRRGFVAAMIATGALTRLRVPAATGSAAWTVLQTSIEAALTLVPERFWDHGRVARAADGLRARAARCEALARRHLDGTALTPRRLDLPPTRVRIPGRPGWLTVTTAVLRVDGTVAAHLRQLADLGRLEELETWLGRVLEFQAALWRRGLFFGATNALENHGVVGREVVLLDASGLTDDPREILELLPGAREGWSREARHLLSRPELRPRAEAFVRSIEARLAAPAIREHWPTPDDPRWRDREPRATGASHGR